MLNLDDCKDEERISTLCGFKQQQQTAYGSFNSNIFFYKILQLQVYFLYKLNDIWKLYFIDNDELTEK